MGRVAGSVRDGAARWGSGRVAGLVGRGVEVGGGCGVMMLGVVIRASPDGLWPGTPPQPWPRTGVPLRRPRPRRRGRGVWTAAGTPPAGPLRSPPGVPTPPRRPGPGWRARPRGWRREVWARPRRRRPGMRARVRRGDRVASPGTATSSSGAARSRRRNGCRRPRVHLTLSRTPPARRTPTPIPTRRNQTQVLRAPDPPRRNPTRIPPTPAPARPRGGSGHSRTRGRDPGRRGRGRPRRGG
jgi:hypothetical protein